MGLLDRIRLKNTSGDEVTKPSRESVRINMGYGDNTEESKDLSEIMPFKVTKNIPNFRYAYKNNDTINTTINNLIITSNSEWIIDCDDKEKYKEAFEHIVDKTKKSEWNLENLVNNIIKYPMVDGSMFINRYIDNGSYKFRILGNDDDRFKWLIIRNPDTDEIIGFKQKCRIKKINGNWKSLKYDTLKSADLEDVEYNFDTDEIIYIPYQEEDGEGVSAINSCLDLAYVENKLIEYSLRASRNAGGFLGVEFGNADIDAGGLDSDDIKEVTDAFELDGNKSVVGYPFGINPKGITAGNLPKYENLILLIQSKIRNNILTPDSKFSGTDSNRSTADEQLNGATGYIVFIRFIQEFVMPIVNEEIIDKELALHYPEAVGKVKFKYIVDIDNEKELSEIGASVIANYPDLPSELVLSTYYNRIWKKVEKYKKVYGENWEDKIDSDLGKFDEDMNSNSTIEKNILGQNAYNRSMHNKSQMLKDKYNNNDTNNEDNE